MARGRKIESKSAPEPAFVEPPRLGRPQPPLERWALGLFLIAFVGALNVSYLRDSDAWWHLKTGEWIWTHRAVPRVEIFSYTKAGVPWVAFEWLSQLLFYLAYRLGAFGGLIAFKTIVVVAAFLIVWSAFVPTAAATMALGLAALCARDFFVERPQIFDLLFLAALLRVLWKEDFARPREKLLWVLPLLALLWANLHGGVALLGSALIVAAAAAERWRNPDVPVRFWSACALLCGAAVLATPHGWRVFPHFWTNATFPGKEAILEWKSPTPAYTGFYWYVLLMGLGLLSAVVLRKRKPFAAGWFLCFAAMSLAGIRNILLFALCAAPLVAEAAQVALESASRRGRLARIGSSRFSWVFVCAALAACGVFDTARRRQYLLPRLGFGTDEALAGAADFLDRENIGGRMFNDYGSGGYLIWKMWPRRPVFVDGRNVEYGPQFVRDAVAWDTPSGWRKLDDAWRFDYALIAVAPGHYTAAVLDASPEFQLAYWDDGALVYLRKTPANAEVLRRLGYEFLQPNRLDYNYLAPAMQVARGRERVLAELDRAIEQAPRGVNARLLKATLLIALRRYEEARPLVERAVALFPLRPQPRYTEGWLHELQGDRARAEESYHAALDRIAPDERKSIGADLRNNLGSLLERRGDLAGARREYDAALSWNPSQPDARRNLDRLNRQ